MRACWSQRTSSAMTAAASMISRRYLSGAAVPVPRRTETRSQGTDVRPDRTVGAFEGASGPGALLIAQFRRFPYLL